MEYDNELYAIPSRGNSHSRAIEPIGGSNIIFLRLRFILFCSVFCLKITPPDPLPEIHHEN